MRDILIHAYDQVDLEGGLDGLSAFSRVRSAVQVILNQG
jgi:uncharacterized protein with HEPN domain